MLLCILFMFAIAGCGEKKPKGMQIMRADLSDKEEKILELTNKKEVGIFDYSISSKVNFIDINILKLSENNKWESIGSSSRQIKGKGRLLISQDKNNQSFTFSFQEDTEVISSTINENEELAEDKKDIVGWSYVWEDGAVDIVANETIPIGIFCETSKNDMRTYCIEDYKENNMERLKEYDTVYAITITFSYNEEYDTK